MWTSLFSWSLAFLSRHAIKFVIGVLCFVMGCQSDFLGRARAYRRGYRAGRASHQVWRAEEPDADCVEFHAFRPDGTEVLPMPSTDADDLSLLPIPYPEPIPPGEEKSEYQGGCN